MMNSTFMVGRIVEQPTIDNSKEENNRLQITLAVPRSYKNADGVYETDFIDCVLWGPMAENTAEYCHKGDMVGIKGRIQTNTYETDSGEKRKSTQVIAEKITFLQSNKSKDSIEKSEDDLDIN